MWLSSASSVLSSLAINSAASCVRVSLKSEYMFRSCLLAGRAGMRRRSPCRSWRRSSRVFHVGATLGAGRRLVAVEKIRKRRHLARHTRPRPFHLGDLLHKFGYLDQGFELEVRMRKLRNASGLQAEERAYRFVEVLHPRCSTGLRAEFLRPLLWL